jgi:oligopeptide/dipeptide ABC transporter ATP-binding protein
MSGGSPAPLLSVRDLRVSYESGDSTTPVVHGVDLDIWPGQALGIVGESGSGKSTALLAAAQLLPSNATVDGGSVMFDGRNLLDASPRELRSIHGREIGMLYQDTLRALNPVMKIGEQIAETLKAHGAPGNHRDAVVELLNSVGISDPGRRAGQYPHQLSGGMRQRVMTAMSLALNPRLLLADEPTTALDVTIQAQILELLRKRAIDHGTATIIVSHDLGVIANLCQRVAVMYGGRVVESGETTKIFADPQHPYTASLINAVPRVDRALPRLPFIVGRPPEDGNLPAGCSFAPRCPVAVPACDEAVPPLRAMVGGGMSACIRDGVAADAARAVIAAAEADSAAHVGSSAHDSGADPLVVVRGLTRHYKVGRGGTRAVLRAVDGVNLEIGRGEFLGLVGESGCGKSTLGRMLVGLEQADKGEVILDGRSVAASSGRSGRVMRRFSQMVFQDPRSSLNRRMTVAQHLEEALVNSGVPRAARPARMTELMEQVGLPAASLSRLPAQFSGGQAQRIAIARALAVSPTLLVADEAVSSLDVSVKGQIVNLLRDLQIDLGITVLFISHDLGVVRHVSDRVAVMYLGRLVEVRETTALFDSPQHPYTKALLSAAPLPDPVLERRRERIILIGDVPNPTDPPAGCAFHTRCQVGPEVDATRDRCRVEQPVLDLAGSATACHFVDGSPIATPMVVT